MATVNTPARPIRQLSERAASRIAAGEVIERPASIIKELLENALDAGAKRIEIEVAGGGLELIRVSDDGAGIDPEQLHLAFSRHATSKLESDDGLFEIATLGFRGEALPSIVAVADVELTSRQPGEDGGAAIVYRYGEFVRQSARASPVGTSLTVKRVFARQPARLKFLRSRASEYQQINAVVEHYALARSDVALRLTIDGRQALVSSGSGRTEDALAAVHGHDVARRLLRVEPYSDRELVISGWIGPPDLNRSNRQSLSLFVNGRWIQNRRLLFALDDAFQGLLPRGRHPIAIILVSIPLDQVDVNAHPTKAEVRFRDEGAVFGAVQRALRQTLSQFAPAPAFVEPSPDGEAIARFWPAPADSGDLRDESVGVDAEVVPAGTSPARDRLPLLRVLGQMGGTYVVAEGPDGMYLIDQHTAHERVLFDGLAESEATPSPSQALLEPAALELSPARRAALTDYRDELREAGFDIDQLDAEAVMVRSVPAGLEKKQPEAALGEFLDALIGDDPAPD
ncbi:MAG TPA: DNA mismatch repair endonuclease MutL, partial [Dehalococcoidia bacterium]|nr:DNA mismatch repair endonuclease MutL [Dehalococcoidia bacterium]